MQLYRRLEEKTKEYISKSDKYEIIEKLSWSSGGELYLIKDRKNIKKTLFSTCFENREDKKKDLLHELFEDSRRNSDYYVKGELIEYENVIGDNTDNYSGCYVYIVMEYTVPLIRSLLDNDSIDDVTKERRAINLLEQIINVCKCLGYVEQHFPDINLYINNEEICINEDGEAKLLLYDIVKNEIAIDNHVNEIKMMIHKMAGILDLKIDIANVGNTIKELENSCIEKKNEVELKEKQYLDKFRKNMEHAKEDNPIVWYNLGCMYESGKGVPKNCEQAIYWYLKAAEKDNAKALNNLAHMYQKGDGVDKNIGKAIEYLERAARLNDSIAQLNLGIAYQTGKGVERDLKKAKYWYKKSKQRGNETAKRMFERIKRYI